MLWWSVLACRSETGIESLPESCDPGPVDPAPAPWTCGAPCGSGERTWAAEAQPFWTDERSFGTTGTPLVLRDAQGEVVVAAVAGGVGGLPARLILLEPDGAVRWELEGEHGLWASEPEAGDLDGDGVPELIVAFYPPADQSSWRLGAVDLQGEVLWIADELAFGTSYGPCIPLVADLERDGALEVLCGEHVLEGATGAWSRSLEPPYDVHPLMLAAAVSDLDRDGVDEILHGGAVYDASGARLQPSPWASDLELGLQISLPLQSDADADQERLLATRDQISLLDDDGSALWSHGLGGDRAGSPCVGDLDGDLWPEVVIPSQRALRAFTTAGELLWEVPASDSSTAAGCTLFDLDSDGDSEVLYADEESFVIRCGVTGELLYQDHGHSSGTGTERPAVADLDSDGSAEILVASEDWAAGEHEDPATSRRGLTVYRHPEGGWSGADTWPSRLPVAENAIPWAPALSEPALRWPAEASASVALQDLQACQRTCGRPVQITATVANVGAASSAAGDVWLSWELGEGETGEQRLSFPELAAGEKMALFWTLEAKDAPHVTLRARTEEPPGCGLTHEISWLELELPCGE